MRSITVEDKEYIIESHATIYHREYQYDHTFREFIEAKVYDFMENSDKKKENIWILEVEGEPKGSISLTRVDNETAQLGLFLVDPSLRGSGAGFKLIQKLIDFSKEQEYRTIILWTNRELEAARHLYQKCGFKLTETKRTHKSNKELLEEKWELFLYEEK
ncbi:GNAT family N-acetyltransferase [Caldalkalibacillus mannanilyticus]|uniref:GNAT family N-acetyltransferase n=1 Tax=Caldalkalibacillus mannanilyticus TaxID=1418 RepID=UPI0022773386|nr:GNAT family N-acetyltransferase [Caldalkalibacillus mannanilyticus]